MSKAISVSTGPIFTIFFTKWKVFVWLFSVRSSFSDFSRDVAMATNLVAKMGQNYLPPALIALLIRKGMGYHYLNVRVNSVNDASISCKNFVKLWCSNPEKTGLICVLFYNMAKTRIFSQISQDILDQFLQSFYHMKALWVQTIELLPCFPIYRGTLPWQSIDFGKMSWMPTDTTCILCTIVRKRVAISLSKCAR